MKPIIFGLENRPSLFIPQSDSAKNQGIKVSEIGNVHLITTSSFQLPLKGEFLYEGELYHFKKIDEHCIDGITYTQLKLSEKEISELYRKLLIRLSPEELGAWMLEELRPTQLEDHSQEESKELSDDRVADSFITKIFEWISTNLYRSPWLSILLLILLSIFPAYHIRNLKVDPSLERILVHGSPEMKKYDESVKIFGSDKSTILLIEDPDIFNVEKLKILRELAWEFQKWPEIERVNSVFTSTFIRSQEETLYTEPLFQTLPYESELLEKVQSNPILHRRLINVPEKNLVFVLKLDANIKKRYLVADKVNKAIEPLKSQFKVFIQTGEPSIEKYQTLEIARTPKIFMPIIALILFLGFFFFVKSMHAFIITILSTGLSLFWSFGIMTYMGIPVQVMITMILGITLTLSATEIVHLATSLKTGWKKGYHGEEAIGYMARDIGKAVFLTFSSTALGFLSILFSKILMLQEFAIVSSLSLFLVFVVTILYLPLHYRIFDFYIQKSSKSDVEAHGDLNDLPLFDKLRSLFYKFYLTTYFSKKPLLLLLAFILIHLFYATKVHMDNDTIEMLSDRTQVKKDLIKFKNDVGGLKEIHLVIDSKENLLSPERLEFLWKVHSEILKNESARDVQSIAGILALLNREMRTGSEEDYKVPHSQNLISQYMLSLSRDDVDPFITPDKRKANIRISHDISSSVSTEKFLEEILNVVKRENKLTGLSYYLTSKNVLNIQAGNTIIESQTLSLLTMSFVVIFLMAIFFKSIKVGLVSLIPNIIPIIGLFGLMGFLDIPLNVGTCIVAAITIGIAADDTIHLFTRYFKDRAMDSNPFHTGKESINEELVPILTTSLSLSLSFFSFVLSTFIPMLQFGVLSAYVLVLAVVSDLYIGPWIITLFDLHSLKAGHHKFTYLLNGRAWSEKSDFGKLTLQEIIQTLNAGKFKITKNARIVPKEDQVIIILKGEGHYHRAGDVIKKADSFSQNEVITLTLSKTRLNHLSPRIFKKFCNNLGD